MTGLPPCHILRSKSPLYLGVELHATRCCEEGGGQDNFALETYAWSLLIDEAVEPHGCKKFTEFPRPSIPIATILRRSLAGVAACEG
jgi:hypothetical protein